MELFKFISKIKSISNLGKIILTEGSGGFAENQGIYSKKVWVLSLSNFKGQYPFFIHFLYFGSGSFIHNRVRCLMI